MQRLRQQVDRIDLKMLRLLQQRTKLSGQIGQMKRRHGGVIYVPERERELVARLTSLSKGKPPARAVAALYREIMSSSRAAQGQTPIGLLSSSAAHVLPASTACFGACDQFASKKSWAELATGLKSGALSLALLTGQDLGKVATSRRWRREFLTQFTVIGDFTPVLESDAPIGRRIFIIAPRTNGGPNGGPTKANRILILIECKSTPNAIKSLLYSMPDNVQSLHAEPLSRRESLALVRLAPGRWMDGTRATQALHEAGLTAGVPVSILGIYPGTEDHGG
jgi:chorismate mutase